MLQCNTEECLIPYDYNYFDFCTGDEKKSAVETLGQVVLGDRIHSSPYEIEFLKNQPCAVTCTKTYIGGDKDSEAKLLHLRKGIALNYKHHWIVDNMPVTWCITLDDFSQYCRIGFPIGCYSGYKRNTCFIDPSYSKPNTYYLFNHVDLTITYHSGESEDWGTSFGSNGGRIISIKVVPQSIIHSNKTYPDCSGNSQTPLEIPAVLMDGEKLDIVYSYSVKFVKNNTIKWSSRWDYIFQSIPGRDIQWFSILSSLVLLLVHSGIVSRIMLRILQNDNGYGKQVFPDKHIEKESRWKLLHGDVFRSPKNEMLLSVLLGSGAQVLVMALITIGFAYLGVFSPENRGALMTCSIVSFACLGSVAGYVSARIYKTFGGEKWKANVLLTLLLCPGFVFGLFFLMNLILWSKGSSAAVPFTTLVALLSLWFGVSVPLTFIGAYFGFRKKSIEHPVGVNYIPRHIPPRTIFTHPICGGFMPFVCILIQLHFIFNMLWTNEMHYIFGFLFLNVFIVLIVCAESTILICYYHLLAEDYHWWWRSFLTGGFTAFYFFIYCIHYFVTKLNIEDVASTFLYFGFALIMAFLFFLLTGTVGFLACFWFVRKIYSVVKLDWLYQELNVFSVNDI